MQGKKMQKPTPFDILTSAIRAVPAVRYALGVAGVAATVAIIASFRLDLRVSLFGIVIMILLMCTMLLFARLSAQRGDLFARPAKALLWASLGLVMATATLLFTSTFFGWPLNLHRLILGNSTENGTTNAIPFGSGWIFLGYFDRQASAYIEGPLARVVLHDSPDEPSLLPARGDVLRIIKPRDLIIADFKTQGLVDQLTPPALIHAKLTDADETGLILRRDQLVLVRDISITQLPGRTPAVWCRVTICDSETQQCLKAQLEDFRN
jgi:hypothetical protein